ncbi:hypothetical protein FWH09_01350 [Candidatus Saccharibacteria bacterium]|nr:hypothetical protein [Candidatus Saccharibacteria bacterium]
MKRNDIALLILASVGSILVAYFLGNSFFGAVEDRMEQVPTFTTISPALAEPRSDVFNEDAINPTVEIEVGQNNEESQDSEG